MSLVVTGASNKSAVATHRRKVLVVNDRYESWGSYYSPFRHLGDHTSNEKIIEYAPELVVCAVFTGGADVDPMFYGQKRSYQTSCTPQRDIYESAVFDACVKAGIPIFGICRGAQFICAKAGGILCQHLDNHGAQDHAVRTAGDELVMMNSYHHQMQLPPDDAEIIAWAEPKLSHRYVGGGNQYIEVDREIEVVHYPKVNALGVQYHPELHQEYEEGWIYYQDLITDFLYTQRYISEPGEPMTMIKKRSA